MKKLVVPIILLVLVVLVSGCSQQTPSDGPSLRDCYKGELEVIDFDGYADRDYPDRNLKGSTEAKDKEYCWVKFKPEDKVFVIQNGSQLKVFFDVTGDGVYRAGEDRVIFAFEVLDGEKGVDVTGLDFYHNDIDGDHKYGGTGEKVVTAADVGRKK